MRLIHAIAVIWLIFLNPHSFAQSDNFALREGALTAQVGIEGLSPELKESIQAERPSADRPRDVCVFLHKRGLAFTQMGQFQDAIRDLTEALALNAPSWNAFGNWCDRWSIQRELASALRDFGDIEKYAERVLLTEREWKNTSSFNALWALNARIFFSLAFSDFDDAERGMREAENLRNRFRASPYWGDLEYNGADILARHKGNLLVAKGNFPEAERFFRESLAQAEKWLEVKEKRDAQSANVRLATANVISAGNRLALNLAVQGKLAEMHWLARQNASRTQAHFGPKSIGFAYSLGVIGFAEFQKGNLPVSESYYRLALNALRQAQVLPHSSSMTLIQANLAEAIGMQGRWQEASNIFEQRGISIQSANMRIPPSADHVVRAMALLNTSKPTEALQMTDRLIAAQKIRSHSDAQSLAQLDCIRAMALSALNRDDEALELFKRTLPGLLELNRLRAESGSFQQTFRSSMIIESYLKLLAKTSARKPSEEIATTAFAYADLARNSRVQAAISQSTARARLPNAELAALARAEQESRNRLAALEQVMARLAGMPGVARLTKVINDMGRDVLALRETHRGQMDELRKKFPDYANLIDPRLVSAGEAQKILGDGEMLVSIYAAESETYVWSIERGSISFRVAALKRSDVEKIVSALRKQLDISHGQLARLDFDPAISHQLFTALLMPDWTRLSRAKTVIFVSNGELAQLPFSALLTGAAQKLPAGAHAGYANLPWLVKQFAVAHAPSVGAFVALRTTPSAKDGRLPMIGFGDPLFSNTPDSAGLRGISVRKIQYQKEEDRMLVNLRGPGADGNSPASNAMNGGAGEKFSSQQAFKFLSELPDTSEELQEIALALGADLGRDLYLRSKASEGELKRAKLDNRRVVVFATHGLVPGDVPGIDQAALALSNPALTGDSSEDGLLTMEEVLGLKLDADWVVLSACNTASSDGKDSEALSGLGRAFFFAGTRSLLVSNWAVETSSARKLTTELFRGESRFPGNRAEPLRQAMLSVMTATGAAGAGESYSYSHPVFWAPFTLVGDPGNIGAGQ